MKVWVLYAKPQSSFFRILKSAAILLFTGTAGPVKDVIRWKDKKMAELIIGVISIK